MHVIGFVAVFFRGALEQPGSTFFEWYLLSPVRVQIGRELVRLITLISSNELMNNMISENLLKKFQARLFDCLSSKNVQFWCMAVFMSTNAPYNPYQRKLNVITQKKYAIRFFI